jgi:hypothetical protein
MDDKTTMDLIASARVHVREAIARRFLSKASPTAASATTEPSAALEVVEQFLRGSGLNVTRSILEPELAKVKAAGGPAAIGADQTLVRPLELAVDLLRRRERNVTSATQTDLDLEMDPLTALGKAPACRHRSLVT